MCEIEVTIRVREQERRENWDQNMVRAQLGSELRDSWGSQLSWVAKCRWKRFQDDRNLLENTEKI